MFNFGFPNQPSKNNIYEADRDVKFKEKPSPHVPGNQKDIIKKTNISVKRKNCFDEPDEKKVHYNPPKVSVTPPPPVTYPKSSIKKPLDNDFDYIEKEIDTAIHNLKSIRFEERVEIINPHDSFEAVIDLNETPATKKNNSEYFNL